MGRKKFCNFLLVLLLLCHSNSLALSVNQTNKILPNLGNHPKPSSQPVCFTQNKGQWNPAFQFIGNTSFGHIGFGQDSIYYHLISTEQKQNQVLKLSLVNADMSNIQGVDPLSYTYNYFIGNDAKKWITNVPNFSRIQYQDVYPGIDLVYLYEKQTPKYEFYVNPGVNPNQIQFQVEGGTLSVSEDLKTLHINTSSGTVSDTSLRVFTRATNHPIQSSFQMMEENVYSFHLSQTSYQEEIVIDPLLYGTYFGASGSDYVQSQDIDSQRNIIVTGYTTSSNFPNVRRV